MISLAQLKDIDNLLPILLDAKKLLKESHSPQWQNDYPNKGVLIDDILSNQLFIYKEENEILGFAVISSAIDHNYDEIYDGTWLTFFSSYLVIHRLAVKSSAHHKHIGKAFLDFAAELAKSKNINSIRVDTHHLNLVMQHLLEKEGYIKVGIIHLLSEKIDFKRLAYEKIIL
ncbi:MAG: GNAT family N-acetyltransferase [Bacilli bacterium]